jgi:dihydrodipicolinate synthase/N-acetylneuraminate lyase
MAETRHPQGILVSCQVPWDEKEQFLEDMFRREIRRMAAAGFRQMYIFGTAGEGHAVDTARFRRIVDVFADEALRAGLLAQVGAIGLSTATVVERLAYAYQAGFRIFQISLPSWGALNDREMMRFFRDVCGAFPDARFLHYNVARSQRLLTPDDYQRLIQEIPNLVATKNTRTTVWETGRLIQVAGELQHFLSEATFPTGCLHGECSLLASSGPLMPQRCREFFELGRSRQIQKLFEMQREYLNVFEAILKPMRRTVLMDGAYDKVLTRLGGGEMPLRLLSPYESFPEEVYQECEAAYEQYLNWIKADAV